MLRLCFGALLFVSSFAEAQERISEREFLRVLQGDHPGLRAIAEREGVARAERIRAGLLANPTASFERESPGRTEQITWGLAWTPPFDGRRGATVRAANAGLRAASSQRDYDRLALRSELRQAFAEWSIATERTRVVDTHLLMIRRLSEQMEARATRGEDSRLAARRLALAALEVEAEAARSAASAGRSRALARAVHPTLPADVQPERPLLPEITDSLHTSGRSDLAARRFEVEQAEWQLRLGRRFLLFPELAFGWQEVRDDAVREEGPRFGVHWSLPLFDRRQAERTEASARLTAARARLEIVQARAAAGLAASKDAYLRLRLAAIQGMEVAAEGDKAVESARGTFRLGESRLTDLLETLRSVLAARLAALELYAAALEAHRALELVVGRPLSMEE